MKLANGLKIAAETISCLYFAFIVIADMRGGSIVGILFRDAIVLAGWGIMMWLSWRSPRYGGFLLITFSMIFWIYPIIVGAVPAPNGAAILLTAPVLLAGLLFLLAAWRVSRARE